VAKRWLARCPNHSESARSWISNSQHTEVMSASHLRDELAFLVRLNEEGLLHTEALMCVRRLTVSEFSTQNLCVYIDWVHPFRFAHVHSAQQRVLLKKYHNTTLPPAQGHFTSEFAPDDIHTQAQHTESGAAQNARAELDVEGGGHRDRSRQTTMEMLGLTFGRHAKRGITSWFIFAGVLHFALDGIFVVFGNAENMTSGWMAPWRVYAQEDERYSRRSSLINAVQVLGAFVHGPLCFVAGWGVHKQRNWYPIVAVLVSFCELYNRVILISTFDSLSTKLGNPSPQFLFAFVTWNLLWIVIPAGA
jgi:hypothetical protein